MRLILAPGAWPERHRTTRKMQHDVEVGKRWARWFKGRKHGE